MTQEGIISTTFQLTTSRRGRRHAQITICPPAYFNSLPHAEVDRLENCCFPRNQNFNSLPHAEVDRVLSADKAVYVLFQLTTSRRGRQFATAHHMTDLEFQLTTSRRGRQNSNVNDLERNHFNSLPHAEVDV